MIARQAYHCDCCDGTVHAGEQYVRFAIPPWLDGEGDVDDEGRSTWELKPPGARRWHVIRVCAACGERSWADEDLHGWLEQLERVAI